MLGTDGSGVVQAVSAATEVTRAKRKARIEGLLSDSVSAYICSCLGESRRDGWLIEPRRGAVIRPSGLLRKAGRVATSPR